MGEIRKTLPVEENAVAKPACTRCKRALDEGERRKTPGTETERERLGIRNHNHSHSLDNKL